eukprot:TRINITY_DN10080_c1_g1_i1.p3 TRINITY_DN10080_c1_g1~~TRINITY_DN10080_c1_g1_i1.p3  ORF type:complete len:199 (-),score=-9.11 TRINITY_DN10080_c1_g1_i1:271-867(-)
MIYCLRDVCGQEKLFVFFWFYYMRYRQMNQIILICIWIQIYLTFPLVEDNLLNCSNFKGDCIVVVSLFSQVQLGLIWESQRYVKKKKKKKKLGSCSLWIQYQILLVIFKKESIILQLLIVKACTISQQIRLIAQLVKLTQFYSFSNGNILIFGELYQKIYFIFFVICKYTLGMVGKHSMENRFLGHILCIQMNDILFA